jgi:hypothetical protein
MLLIATFRVARIIGMSHRGLAWKFLHSWTRLLVDWEYNSRLEIIFYMNVEDTVFLFPVWLSRSLEPFWSLICCYILVIFLSSMMWNFRMFLGMGQFSTTVLSQHLMNLFSQENSHGLVLGSFLECCFCVLLDIRIIWPFVIYLYLTLFFLATLHCTSVPQSIACCGNFSRETNTFTGHFE